MKLLLSDTPLNVSLKTENEMYIDLSALKISNCVGCFGCWTTTPGKCVIRDDAVKVYVSHIKYGSYDTVMKTMLERAIPVQQAFIRIYNNETHHVQRAVKDKEAVIIAYGELSQEEKDIFSRLVARNANNMSFSSYRIVFVAKEELTTIVEQEVASW
mgnify:CR=1 FL=1